MLVPLRHATALLSALSLTESNDPLPHSTAALFIGISAVLVVLSGLMSGLTISLLAMDEIEMEVLVRGGTDLEKKYAVAIAPLLRNHHFLLCTLVVWNAFSMEALPVFLDRLADPFTAVLLSVTVVLFFGEIVPQSICTHYGLAVGYYASGLLRVLMALSSPIAWPLSRLLDVILGHSTATLPRSQLQQFVALHGEDEGFAALGEALTRNEAQIINCALELTAKTAAAAMTPLHHAFMVSTNDVLDDVLRDEIIQAGHSRVPVHAPGDRTSILGLLLVKDLLLVKETKRVSQLKIRSLPALSASMPMWDVLQLFKAGGAHMAVLCEAPEHEREAARQSLGARSVAHSVCVSSDSCDSDSDTVHEALLHRASEEDPQALIESADEAVMLPAKKEVQDMIINAAIGIPIGIITIEDIMEELLGDEIIDETDRFVDNLKTAKVDRAALRESLPKALRPLHAWGSFVTRAPNGRRSEAELPILADAEPLLEAADVACALWRPQLGRAPHRGSQGKLLQGTAVSSLSPTAWRKGTASRVSSVGSMDAAPWHGSGRSDYVSLCLGCSSGTNAVVAESCMGNALTGDSFGVNTIVGDSCGADSVVGDSGDFDGSCWSCSLDAVAPTWPALRAIPAAGRSSGFRAESATSGQLTDSSGPLPGGPAGDTVSSCQTLSARSLVCDAAVSVPAQ